jgi:Flp pilus assembly protein CpaB
LKRSNRLVLLIGVFLAVVAFVGVILLSSNSTGTKGNEPVTTGPVVVATADIGLSTKVRADQVTVQTLPLTAILPGAFQDTSQVIGKVVRQAVASGAQLTSDTFGGVSGVQDIVTPKGMRSIAVQVDQVTGVGTVIKNGDYVDMVVGFASDKFPVVQKNPVDNTFTVVGGLNGTSVKLLLQGMQVLGTLLPPPTTDTSQPAPSGGTTTTLNGQQEIVILAVTPQQSEVIKFAQLDGSISLILRSADDFIDPTTGEIIPAVVPDKTTGVILKTLVESYGVLPPELVETVTPAK